jgi:hypothetical protein
MKQKNNITVITLIPGRYSNPSTKVEDCITEFFCAESGVMEITTNAGNSFVWNAKPGEKINVVSERALVFSGKFICFFTFFKGIAQSLIETSEDLVDENNNNLIDELNNKFIII